MTKGLNQMVSEALAEMTEAAKPKPVDVSGDALYVLTQKMREWSGWHDASLTIGTPMAGSPWASTDDLTRSFIMDPDELILNPHRVLYTVTPFRLRQEAVLTGVLLHEAGHARFSNWIPLDKPLLHSDGTVPTKQTVALARLMEEARVEGLMVRDAAKVGADGLDWTMRAMAAHLLPPTTLSADPAQQIMDLIQSWALRAGRQYPLLDYLPGHRLRHWVQDFTTLVNTAITNHLTDRADKGAEDVDPALDANTIMRSLVSMTTVTDHTGPTMIDEARKVLDLLFPETPGEDNDEDAMPQPGCAMPKPQQDEQSEEDGEPSESEGKDGESDKGEGGKGNSEPEDSGEGDEPGEGEAGGDGEQGGKGESDQPSDDSGDGATSSTDEPSEGESEAQNDGGGDGEEVDTDSPLAKALAEMESDAKDSVEDETEEAAEDAEDKAANGAGKGSGGHGGGGWRDPSVAERDQQRGAERFLRSMIDPSETAKVVITDQPSATVDAGALAAWRAGGQHTDPRFFKRTRREIQPSPPVEIAILVDVSLSMSSLQKPSSVLSWSLAAAALDLANFAGRGQQIRSCLIHWGDDARVMQGVGEMLPGIREHSCNEGTSAMGAALRLVEEQIPGFFDASDRPVNRLLVQFTDWELYAANDVVNPIARALAAGVNMLSVVPQTYRPGASDLDSILRRCITQRGKTSLLKYNKMFPDQVWEQAAETLSI